MLWIEHHFWANNCWGIDWWICSCTRGRRCFVANPSPTVDAGSVGSGGDLGDSSPPGRIRLLDQRMQKYSQLNLGGIAAVLSGIRRRARSGFQEKNLEPAAGLATLRHQPRLFYPGDAVENGGLLPAVALLFILWWKRRTSIKSILGLVPMLVIGAALAWETSRLETDPNGPVGAVGPDWQLSFVQRLLIAGRDLWFYVGKLVAPIHQSFVYPRHCRTRPTPPSGFRLFWRWWSSRLLR